MPGLDGTGPMGMGPMTGGRRGWCNPLWAGYGASAGFGYPSYGGYPWWPRVGYGSYPWAYGMGYPYYSPIYSYGNTPGYPYVPSPWGSPYGSPTAPEGEKEWLKSQADSIQQQIDEINSRIAQLEKE